MSDREDEPNAFVFPFDHSHTRPPRQLRNLLGGKGANLAEMTSVLGLPVPPGFTISTRACTLAGTSEWPEQLTDEVARAIEHLEASMGRRLGDSNDPLLVSVRSGAGSSMPGMLDTILNLGLNDASVEALARETRDERFALDTYARFIAMYGRVVLGLDSASNAAPPEGKSVDAGPELPAPSSAALRSLVARLLQTVTEQSSTPFPQNPSEQLRQAITAVFRSWNSPRAVAYRQHENIPHHLGTAVNVQVMVFGNRDERSGTGVAFTRNPSTGEREPFGDVLFNAQGEDVVAGIRNTLPLAALADRLPDVYSELLQIFGRLETHYRDMCDTEFTIEQGKLWMLQTRSGKRSGRAALRIAVEMVMDPAIALSEEEAVDRITAEHLRQVVAGETTSAKSSGLTTGIGASPGAAVGRVYFTADDAVEAADRGEPVILVRSETSPEDVHGMLAAEGLLTAHGGLASHAAVIARGWGKPAVVGASQLVIEERALVVEHTRIEEGEWLSIDGSSGVVSAGRTRLSESGPPAELAIVTEWALRQGRSLPSLDLTCARNGEREADASVAE
jgi:pyruvate, orthophosphate dikinase